MECPCCGLFPAQICDRTFSCVNMTLARMNRSGVAGMSMDDLFILLRWVVEELTSRLARPTSDPNEIGVWVGMPGPRTPPPPEPEADPWSMAPTGVCLSWVVGARHTGWGEILKCQMMQWGFKPTDGTMQSNLEIQEHDTMEFQIYKWGNAVQPWDPNRSKNKCDWMIWSMDQSYAERYPNVRWSNEVSNFQSGTGTMQPFAEWKRQRSEVTHVSCIQWCRCSLFVLLYVWDGVCCSFPSTRRSDRDELFS